MQPLNAFLTRFTRLTPPEKTKRALVVAAIKKHTGITLLEHEFHIGRTTIHLRCHAVVREQIREKEREIVEDLIKENVPVTQIF